MDKKITIFQPENINEDNFIKKLEKFKPDIILVVAYGQILSEKILNVPRIGCINIHGSLLPKYRGAAPINQVIINGEKETGITFIDMNERVDDGDIVYKQKIEILPDETFGELSKRLSALSAEVTDKVLQDLKRRKLSRIPQDRQLATYTKKMSKQDGEIAWNNKSQKIYNTIRGTIPYPGAYTYYKGKKLKITKAGILHDYKNKITLDCTVSGVVVGSEKDNLLISTGDEGIIKISRLIPAGAKEMSVRQFVNGYKIQIGDKLGE